MEREKFIRRFYNESDQLDKKKIMKNIERSIAGDDKLDPSGCRKYIKIMEELSELSQQVSKAARGMGDKMCLTEEMADVLLSVMMLQKIHNISTLDLYKAMNVKVNRLEQKINTEGVYF